MKYLKKEHRISFYVVTNLKPFKECVASKIYFFGGWVEMWHCVPNVFTFVAEKEHNFQKNESIACTPPYKKEKKKPDLSELTQIFCDLLFLLSNYF